MLIYIYYTIATILLSIVDLIRIRQAPITKSNINHKVSAGLAILFGIAIWLIFTRPILQWPALLFIVAFLAIRGLVYDLLLNKLRGLNWDYVSPETDAKTDNWMNRFTFWQQRLIYAVAMIIVLIIQHVFIK